MQLRIDNDAQYEASCCSTSLSRLHPVQTLTGKAHGDLPEIKVIPLARDPLFG